MKAQMIVVFLVIALAACAPAQTIPTDVQNTAVAIVQTEVARTQAALATATPTATILYPTPSPFPTQPPPPILTPDAIQVERWQEYQAELAKIVLSGYHLTHDDYDSALCEWDILGHAGQQVYVWALCAIRGGGNARHPAIIYLEADGTIQSVKVPGYDGPFYDLRLFPEDVQEKLDIYISPPISGGRPSEMGEHLQYRQIDPDEPPLVVLSAMPTP